jgi:MFS family permease
MVPLCVAVISNAYPAERQARAIGNLYGLAAIATALGPFVGGAFTDFIGWRWIFFLNLPIGVLAIAALLHFVEESRDETVPRRLDWPGLAAVALGIALVTFAVDRGQEWGWLGARTVIVFLAGLALLAIFVAIERRVRWPLVDLGLFRNRPYVLVTALGTVSNVAFTSATLATTIYLQQVRDFSPLAAGSIFLACSLALAVTGPLAGRLGERFRVSRVIPISIGIGAAGLVLVALDPGLLAYLLGLVVFGFGYGLGWTIVSVGTQQVVPVERAGAASGVTLALVVGFGGLGVAITAALIEALTASGTAEGDAIESILLGIAAGSALLGGLLELTARRAAARAT